MLEMKKRFVLCFLLIMSFLLVPIGARNIKLQNVSFSVIEFGSPFIPSASQIGVKIPFLIKPPEKKNVEILVDLWYRAASPYLAPDPFFELGVVPSVNLLGKDTMKLYVGLGTAYSQGNKEISIPAIVPIRYQYRPYKMLDLGLLLQSMIYTSGVIAELDLTADFGPFGNHFFITIGGSMNIFYEWKQSLNNYSYGLLFGLGYRL